MVGIMVRSKQMADWFTDLDVDSTFILFIYYLFIGLW